MGLSLGNIQLAQGGILGNSNTNIFVPKTASDFTSPDIANANKIWELQTEIDLGGAVVDLSTYNIKLKDGGGKLTNFTSIDLGDFSTEGNPSATYFDQSGTITGYCLDGDVYIQWFGPHKNGHLIDNTVDPTGPASLNGALPDHIAIQNAMAVSKDSNGDWMSIHFPKNAVMMQGDATNPEYQTTNPFLTYEGGTALVNGVVQNTATFAIDNLIGNVTIGNEIWSDQMKGGITIVSYSAPNITVSEPVTLSDNSKIYLAGQYVGSDGAISVIVDGFPTGEIGTMQGFEFDGVVDFDVATFPPVYREGPKIYGNGSTVISHPRQALTEDNKGFEFFNLKNIYVENLTYDGNIIQRDPIWSMASNVNRQHAFSFQLCINPVLNRVTGTRSAHDGFSFGGYRYSNSGTALVNGAVTDSYTFNIDGLSGSVEIGNQVEGTNLDSDPYIIGFDGTTVTVDAPVTLTDNLAISFTVSRLSGEGGEMRNCSATYNYRQGMSGVNHKRLKVYNSEFSFNGQLTSLVDGRQLAVSPHAGVDLEQGFTSTDNNDRGQEGWLFESCRFENNLGSNLAIHWGAYNTIVRGCYVIEGEIFEPSDSEGLTSNNTYENNVLKNGWMSLAGGGQHVIGNKFVFNQLYRKGGGTENRQEVPSQSLTVFDSDLNYLRENVDGIVGARTAVVRDNIINVQPFDFSYPLVGVTQGRIDVIAGGAIVENNVVIDAIGITAGGTDNTLAVIGTEAVPARRVNNNIWKLTPRLLAKYTGNVGRLSFNNLNGSFDRNIVPTEYAPLSSTDIHASNSGVELRGSYAKFSSYGGTIDGDDAFEIYVPNDNGDIKITWVGGSDLGNSVQETWLSTYDLTHRGKGYAHGTTESTWGFIDPVVGTNPKTGASAYKIVAAHDVAGNVNYEGQFIVEWFGQNGNAYNEDEFLVYRNTTYGTVTGLRRVYTGGLTGTTANIPTTGGVGNYTEIKIGADYYDTDTNTMKYWNGSSFA